MPEEIVTMEYYDWVAEAGFKDSKEHHEYISRADQDFLQYVIYPMFYQQYRRNGDRLFKTSLPFPLVLRKKTDVKHPIFVISNDYFTIVFFKYVDHFEGEECWEVSFHINDHAYCDERIREYKDWFRKYYNNNHTEMNGMPKRFVYDCLDLHYDKKKRQKNFCIEFWNYGQDCMLFKLLDMFRLF